MATPRGTTADCPPSSAVDLPAHRAATIAVGGALLVLAAFLSWLGRGTGSSMSLREAGDFVLGSRWSTVSRWAGLLAYVIPVCGGLAIIAAGLPARRARRLSLCLGGLVALLLAVVAVALVERNRTPAAGFVVAVLGDLLLLAGAVPPLGFTKSSTTG